MVQSSRHSLSKNGPVGHHEAIRIILQTTEDPSAVGGLVSQADAYTGLPNLPWALGSRPSGGQLFNFGTPPAVAWPAAPAGLPPAGEPISPSCWRTPSSASTNWTAGNPTEGQPGYPTGADRGGEEVHEPNSEAHSL
jgi:hypothetical protein